MYFLLSLSLCVCTSINFKSKGYSNNHFEWQGHPLSCLGEQKKWGIKPFQSRSTRLLSKTSISNMLSGSHNPDRKHFHENYVSQIILTGAHYLKEVDEVADVLAASKMFWDKMLHPPLVAIDRHWSDLLQTVKVILTSKNYHLSLRCRICLNGRLAISPILVITCNLRGNWRRRLRKNSASTWKTFSGSPGHILSTWFNGMIIISKWWAFEDDPHPAFEDVIASVAAGVGGSMSHLVAH